VPILQLALSGDGIGGPSGAAARLKIKPPTLQYRMKRVGLAGSINLALAKYPARLIRHKRWRSIAAHRNFPNYRHP